jgi:hypothetical protein
LQSSALSFPVTLTLRATLEINLSAACTPRYQGQGTKQEVSRIFLRINHKLSEMTDGKDLFGWLFPGTTKYLFYVLNHTLQGKPIPAPFPGWSFTVTTVSSSAIATSISVPSFKM